MTQLRKAKRPPDPSKKAPALRAELAASEAFKKLGLPLSALLLLAAGTVFALYAHYLFDDYPPVWPDEALFASPAIELLHHGKMGCPVLDVLPGIRERTYLYPPLYYLYLCPFFAILGPGLAAMRVSSLAAGGAVVLMLYLGGRRAGLARLWSLVPPSLLLLDRIFLRGSLIGRMDMLTVFLLLLTIWQWLDFPGSRAKSFLTGLFAGLAILAHPLGCAAAAIVLLSECVHPHGPRLRHLPAICLGVFVMVLPWGIYILQDPGSFVTQFGAQILRKSGRVILLKDRLLQSPLQYGADYAYVLVYWATGLAGLVTAAIRRRKAIVFVLAQAFIIALVIWSFEMWYVLYLAPLTALGTAELLSLRRRPMVLLLTAVVLAGCGWFVGKNLANLEKTRLGHTADYQAWCDRISGALPRGSRVFLSSIPDPYLGLVRREDLAFREFAPIGFPIEWAKYEQYIADCDYVVANGVWGMGDADFVAFMEKRTVPQSVIAGPKGEYRVGIYRVKKGPVPGPPPSSRPR